ncbi:hypothetical protein EPUL_006369, partial [Erysiphe pulchra]
QSESARYNQDIQSESQDFSDTDSSFDYQESSNYSLDIPFDSDYMMELIETASMSATKSVSMVKLTKWQDYPLWFDQIKLWAKKHEIWDVVNPAIQENQVYTSRPSIPEEPVDINNAEQRAIWQIRNSVYLQKYQEWYRIQNTLDRFNEIILSSVDSKFHVNFMGKETERERLLALEVAVKPTDIEIQTDLLAEYVLLYRRIHNLISSLQPLYYTTASFRKNKVNDKINEGEDVKLKDQIRAWTTLLQQEGIERFPTASRAVGNDKAALSASFQGKTQASNLINQETKPTCPCGLTHWPSQCYYLNPQRRRKPNWKMNKEVAK